MNLIRLIIVLFSTSFFIACDDGGAERASKQKKKEGHWEKPLTDPDPVEEEEKLEAEAESDVFEEETEEEDPSNAELNNKVKIAPKSQDVPEEVVPQVNSIDGVFDLKTCNNVYGRVFVPLPGDCEEEMVQWECCEEQVLARFPKYRDALKGVFAKNKASDFALYNCGQKSPDQVVLHWAFMEGDFIDSHKTTVLESAGVEPDEPVACSEKGSQPPAKPQPFPAE